jgi:hypothetical protein
LDTRNIQAFKKCVVMPEVTFLLLLQSVHVQDVVVNEEGRSDYSASLVDFGFAAK